MTADRFVPVDASLSTMCWRRNRTYDFARRDLGAPIVASEVSLVASFAPFVFLRSRFECVPYTLFALSGNRNAFVSPEGEWRGCYVPARQRTHPFLMSRNPRDDTVLVRKDALLRNTQSNGVPFFAEDGGFSEPLRRIQRFLIEYRTEAEKTRKLMRKVDRLGLLTHLELDGLDRRDKKRLFVVDWKSVSESKAITTALSKDMLLQRVLHAHAVSLMHIGRLRTCASRWSPVSIETKKPHSGLEDFLDAVGGAIRHSG